MSVDEPEDILSGSLQYLYDYAPITLASAGSSYLYSHPALAKPISLQTPDPQASNWALHASSIWASSRFIADNIQLMNLAENTRVLELGAGAGLPSIVVAQIHPSAHVVISDYPDPELIATLTENVFKNNPWGNARVVAYAWGTEPCQLLTSEGKKFDLVIAADTLWNPDLHVLFIDTLTRTLEHVDTARIHLVAGLHTGRYTIQSFLNQVVAAGFSIESATEMESIGESKREWDLSRAADEDEQERRRWVLWIVLKWA